MIEIVDEDAQLFRLRLLAPDGSNALFGYFLDKAEAEALLKGRSGWVEKLASPAWIIAEDIMEYVVVRKERLDELLRAEQVIRSAAAQYDKEESDANPA